MSGGNVYCRNRLSAEPLTMRVRILERGRTITTVSRRCLAVSLHLVCEEWSAGF